MTADEVLADLGWVRRLAAQLARDDGEDVAQEAWTVALRDQPARDRPLRAWLAEVMRRVAHTRRRAAARRRARELQVAGDAQTPAADSLLEKAELLRLVGELVAQLDEPLRSTVLLRYYEGLSSAQIAAREGVPAGTVRWRLKQAVDALRERLDARVNGGRRAWALVLAPPAGAALKLAVAAAALAVVAGGAGVVLRPGPAAAPAAPVVVRKQSDGSLYQRAQEAYVHGQYADAIELGKQLVDEDHEKGWRIVGASSCFLQDSHGATAAWNELEPTGKKFIEYVCSRNETPLPEITPAM